MVLKNPPPPPQVKRGPGRADAEPSTASGPSRRTSSPWKKVTQTQAERHHGSYQTLLLSFPGDLLDLHTRGDAGWWYGGLNGRTGHFPSSYVEELPAPSQVRLPDSAADSGQN